MNNHNAMQRLRLVATMSICGALLFGSITHFVLAIPDPYLICVLAVIPTWIVEEHAAKQPPLSDTLEGQMPRELFWADSIVAGIRVPVLVNSVLGSILFIVPGFAVYMNSEATKKGHRVSIIMGIWGAIFFGTITYLLMVEPPAEEIYLLPLYPLMLLQALLGVTTLSPRMFVQDVALGVLINALLGAIPFIILGGFLQFVVNIFKRKRDHAK